MEPHVFATVVEILAMIIVSPGIVLVGWALGEFLSDMAEMSVEPIPYQEINQELRASFGHKARLIPGARDASCTYTLRFEDDGVDKEVIEKACEIVNKFVVTVWYDEWVQVEVV